MKRNVFASIFFVVFLGSFSAPGPADGFEKLGTGNASLLGGDLTDPTNRVIDSGNYGPDLPESRLRPRGAAWLRMTSAPNSPPGTAPHQRHSYQSWQNTPACAIFLNNPEKRKWYVGFKDGGNGGPTKSRPYFCAVQLRKAVVLTHFSITTAPDMPGRDPMTWAIQGSNTGEEGDWKDIYRCDVKDRISSPLIENPRCQTTLFSTFTSANMIKVVETKDRKRVLAKLRGRKISEADFDLPQEGFTWFRVAVFSCFNGNSNSVADARFPPGFSLGQVELFGLRGKKPPARAKKALAAKTSQPVAKLVKPPVYDAPFIISYWCGPPKSETTLSRYQQIADAGFNVAFPAIDADWSSTEVGLDDEHLEKFLDLCEQVGIKGLIWAGIPLGGRDRKGWDAPATAEMPRMRKHLNSIVSKYSRHPALLGYYLDDEPGVEKFARLGAINQYLLKKDPKHLPYINLLPNYANSPDWKGAAYGPTIAKYLETVKPALLSWDHYRQMFGANGDESYYWHNLEAVRRQCRRARVPYLQIICSLKHMGYRQSSEADLRWQVYTSLAYGSRGIMYFTYWDVKGLAWAGAPALMTMDGKPDAQYYYAQRINRRIAALGPTLVKLTSTGAYCTAPVPPGGVKLAASAPVKDAQGGPLLIGCFENAAGKQYVFPVNRSFRRAFTAELTLGPDASPVSEISQKTGKPRRVKLGEGGVLSVALEPGEGRLFVLPRKSR